MSKHTTGLVLLEVGAIAADGGVSIAFGSVGETIKGSASLTSTDPTVTDFDIEESDSPVESITTAQSEIDLAWSTYNIESSQLVRLYGGTVVYGSSIATAGTLVAGSTYTNGTYLNVPFVGGTGSGASGTIVFAAGAGALPTITNFGSGYTVGDVLSVAAANVGGTGAGYSFQVATITNGGVKDVWSAPDTLPPLELSVRVTDRKGNVVVFPRTKITSKLGMSFSKDKVGQLDIKAKVLQPTKIGTKRMIINYY